ncbi:ribonuclease H-like domain-containing protein, partial [Tanacetum coccineum]
LNDDEKDSSVEEGSLPHSDESDSTKDHVKIPVLIRSERQSKPPVRLNDYVVSSNGKYGIEKQWNAKLTTALAEHGFERSKFNYSLYTKQNGNKFVALLVYVDDIVITRNDDVRIKEFKRKYCLELLHEYGLLAARHVDIPLPENSIISFKETNNDKYLSDFTTYQKLVGKLLYLTNTRPNNSYAVHCLSQHMHNPLQSHFKAALRVLRYLKGSP